MGLLIQLDNTDQVRFNSMDRNIFNRERQPLVASRLYHLPATSYQPPAAKKTPPLRSGRVDIE